MFTVIAFFAIAAIGWFVNRANSKAREHIVSVDDSEVRQSVLHARQDIRLIAFLLAAILIMLGIIADRMH